MNDKVPIIRPSPNKKPLKNTRTHQNITDDSSDPNANILLKDIPEIPQVNRKEVHEELLHKRSKIPCAMKSIRKPSSPRNHMDNFIDEDEKYLLFTENIDSMSEPGYITHTSYRKKNSRVETKTDDVDSENDDFFRVVPLSGRSAKKFISRAESARENPTPKQLLQPSPKTGRFSQFPKEPTGSRRSPRKVRLLSIREEIEREFAEKVERFANTPFKDLFYRTDVLVAIAKSYFPDSKSDQEAILELIELNKSIDELKLVKNSINMNISKNKELLLIPFRDSKRSFNAKQLREAESIVNELWQTKKRITKLKNMSISSDTMPIDVDSKDQNDRQVSFTKEKKSFTDLAKDVTRLENEIASVEKRIKLMTQGKSNYAGLHADRITDQYEKQLIEIPRLGEDTEEDMIDNGIFSLTVHHDEDEDDENN